MPPTPDPTDHQPRDAASGAWVAGVDGCRAGWIAVLAQDQGDTLTHIEVQLCSSFDVVLGLEPRPAIIAVDIPIGLLDIPQPGGRECDRQARRLLGRRSSSVFSPPSRRILLATHYDDVRAHGMSRQSFGILPKIREVDGLITPESQDRVYEAHPELAFTALAGEPMQHNKKTRAGHDERLRALTRASGPRLRGLRPALSRALAATRRNQVATDDLLDACVLARTAARIARGHGACVPTEPPRDTRGLRMEIWR